MRIVWENGGPVPLDAAGCCPECRHYRWGADGSCLQPGCPSRARAGEPAVAPKQGSRPKKPGAAVARHSAAVRKERQEQEYLRKMGLKQKP